MKARCGDLEVAWFEWGRGQPLVLVHGLADDHRAWRKVVAGLALDHRVIAYDLRGHGQTSLGRPDGSSAYIRLSTRQIDQLTACVPEDPAARERRRCNVVAGAYLLKRCDVPTITICAMGAMMPEALGAASRLDYATRTRL